YLYSEVANASDGVIRAAENNGVTTSRLQVYDHITNAGLAEANGGNLWFMGGSSVTNSGVLQAVNGNEIRFQSGATVTDAGGGILSLSDAGTGYITDSGTIVEAQTNVAESSTLYLRNSAVLDGVGVQLDGTMEVYNATVAAPLTISATGEAISTYQSSSSPARFNSPVTIESGGKLSMYNYWSAVDGDGLITNHGLIQGASNNSSYQTYLYSEVANASDGVIRAAENNGITTSRLEIYDHITNAGLVEANGGNLRFMGDSSVTNSGVLQAVAGNEIRFQSGATVTDAGGGTLSLSDGGTGYITDSGTIVEAQTNVADGSTLYLRNSAVLDGVGVQLDGVMEVYNATVAAPLTISATGEAIPTSTYSSPARFDGSVTIENGGKLSMYNNSSATSGEGLITNHGLIQGAAVSNGNWTYLYSDVLNEADGVIRAARNDIAMNTGLYVYGDITNAGAMEADGGTLYLTGATVANSGIIRATNDSQVTFISGTVVSDSGGTLRIEPTGTGLISGSGTQVEATTVVDDGGALTLTSSALLLGPSVQVDGDMYVQSSRVDAPVTVGLTGNVIANSSTATFDKAITVLGDGVTAGALSVVGNSDRISGLGDIENFGLIEGGAPSNSYTTYLDNEVVNRSTGTIRAFSNGGATNTTFAINGNIVNEGLMEADGATLSMSGITVDNTAGSWSAVNGGRLLVSGSFVGGASGSNTTIDGDTSSLELTNGSLVGFDSLTLTNGGDVSVSGTNTSLFVLSPFTIPDGSVATVASSGRLQAGGITVDGTLAGQGGTVISDVHLNAPGLIDATSGSTIIEGDVTTTAGSLISVTNSSTGLVVNGTLDNAAGATVRLNSNTTALSGDGLFTNAGLLEGGAFNNNNTVTMSKVFSNSGDVVATSASAATGTTFQITSPTIGNTGTMTATDAHLTISGSQMTHSGTMRAENGNRLRFQSSATVGDVGGSFGGVEIDGDASLLDVLSSSSVSLGSLSLTDGGDASVTGSASLDVMAPFTVGVGSELTVSGWGMLSGGGVQVDNLMYAGASTITAPTTIGPTGELFITSSSGAMFDAPIT
ncbi:MAG: hypothetical protein KAV82_13795, partial [Phycisphaerae bacterium]|nr:hypothetical protein [Phycisphaerae bacterium]